MELSHNIFGERTPELFEKLSRYVTCKVLQDWEFEDAMRDHFKKCIELDTQIVAQEMRITGFIDANEPALYA